VAQWIESVVGARFLVAGLSESASPPWWRTDALSPAGQHLLARLFPWIAVGAGLETASRAAATEQDNHGRCVGAYHIFRLPIADETVVRDHLRLPEADRLLQEVGTLVHFKTRLDALGTLTGGEISVDPHGPLHCGTTNGIRRGMALRRLCAASVDAFGAGRTVYPFLTEGTAL
jgi:hypothetical protein